MAECTFSPTLLASKATYSKVRPKMDEPVVIAGLETFLGHKEKAKAKVAWQKKREEEVFHPKAPEKKDNLP